jgi:N-hydroxyarylamine O-acetyltransferase
MDTDKYLKRIKFTGNIKVDNETFFDLHERHVMQVPFENLDIHYKRSFDLEFNKVFKKIVDNQRGGFCYELNYLFSNLLNELGFICKIISSQIFTTTGVPGPLYDHMSLYVKTDKEYLADVGFGDLFIRPLEIKEGVQADGRSLFKIEKYDTENYLLLMSEDGIDFQKKYIFNLNEVNIERFLPLCFDKQTNPYSYFVQNVICTKPTTTGRITIFNNKLIETFNDEKLETLIDDDSQLRAQLHKNFNITLE